VVNEDIATSLRNAVQHGESLQEAMNMLVHSGYNVNEVQEASKFVTTAPQNAGALQVRPEQELIMPTQKKSFFSGLFKKKSKPSQDLTPKVISKYPQQTKLSALSQPAQLPQQFQQSISSQPQTPPQPPTLPPAQLPLPPIQQQQLAVQQPKQPTLSQTQPQTRPLYMQQPKLPQQPQPTPSSLHQSQQTQQHPPKKGFGLFHKKPLSRELKQIKPPEKSHKKEAMLLLILLVLVGLLIGTIAFRDTILGWFS